MYSDIIKNVWANVDIEILTDLALDMIADLIPEGLRNSDGDTYDPTGMDRKTIQNWLEKHLIQQQELVQK